jgi:ABC-type sugar transport system ATPase subunit
VVENAEPDGIRPRLSASGLRKRFDGVEVLHGVDLDLWPGEVHALVGENGAGKSTIINLLSGRLQPDGGTIQLDGMPVELRNPLAARRAGISIIAQELEVVPTLTIVENVFLGVEPTKLGFIRWRDARRQVVSLLGELGVDASPDRVAGSMGVADQQLVEIAKAIVGQFQLLIMDEPTSALNLQDTERLFRIVRRLKAAGVAVLYVSHRLWEVFDLADRVTVVRDGDRITTAAIGNTDVGTVIRGMLGDKSSLVAGADRRPRAVQPFRKPGPPALELMAVKSGDLLQDITFRVEEGEVVGLAGVIGSGRTELCEAIYGLRVIETGEIKLNGKPTKIHGPKNALEHGVFMLPEDRKSAGIFGRLDVRENIILDHKTALAEIAEIDSTPPEGDRGRQRNKDASFLEKIGFSRIGFSAENRTFHAMRKSLSIRCSGPDDRITALSGGNQQKALFARGTLAQPAVLLLSEPTRGVDVGAKEEIYSAIDQFAKRGIAIVVSSSELSELMRLATVIYVMRNGRVVARLRSNETSEEEILERMAG